ncbi:MAG: phosphatidate cytidylyltransferase [Oscillospiraceae bacterium]|nr:phosphatidate cytidylyltransferase [Oscillospiraceae bacterium]
MKTRVLAAVILVPLIFIVLFFLPPYVLAGVISVICAISAYELLKAISGKQSLRILIYAISSAVIIPIGAYFGLTEIIFPAFFLLLMSLSFFEAIMAFQTHRSIAFSQVLIILFAGALIPLMMISLLDLKLMEEGRFFVLLPIICAFLTDAGAYFTGLTMGRKKAFPLVSPKKTVAGCIGGLVVGTLSMLAFGAVIAHATEHQVIFWAMLLYGIIGSALSQLGDLAFSLVKREFEIKDYGKLIPGHGGMLDRFDSMIFTAPAIYLLVTLIPAIVV